MYQNNNKVSVALSAAAVASLLLWAQNVEGFAPSSLLLTSSYRSTSTSSTSTSTSTSKTSLLLPPLFGIRCEDKFYQLEEREDAECATTELYLMADRSIDFGETDGPLPVEIEGTWDVEPGTDNFSMKVRRRFGTGKGGTDMGEFEFDIVRTYTGEMTMVGESVAITGAMVNIDDLLGEKEVGFFNMIDGTKERESYGLEGRFKYEIDMTKGNKVSEIETIPPPPQQEAVQQPDPERYGDFGVALDPPPTRLGPGGVAPMDVYNAMPPAMAEAFRNRDLNQLLASFELLSSQEETDYYMKGAIDSGLWLTGDQVMERKQRLGPGGLDPIEVWDTLPPLIAAAFENRSVEQLDAVLSSMPREEADYHMQRCIAAGLWQG